MGNNAIPLEHDFLTGGGEMGERIRNFDWSKNPLGPPANWPYSLKTIVRIMLTSQQPIWIGWGKQLIKLYNDPYKAIVGGKHPWALGEPASVVWKDIWNDIDPMLRHVMEENVGTYVDSHLLIMERYGYKEETYYTFSYSPVPDDNGNIGGMFCANTDSTERVIGERQLKLLRELASKTLNAATVHEVLARTASSLESNLKDLPFALLYQQDDSENFKLVAASGINKGHQAAPEIIKINQGAVWPVESAVSSAEQVIIKNLKERFTNLPMGLWDDQPHTAVLLPITTSKSSRPLVLIAALNPFRLYNEEYEGFIKLIAGQISQSMTNVLALEEERNRAAALAEIDKAKTVFFSNISHEFRTPLTLMLGPLQEILNDHSFMNSKNAEQVKIVYRNSLRLLRLVNTLLDFSRIEAGKLQPVFRQTDIVSFTADLSSSFRSAIENAGIIFTTEFGKINAAVYLDHTMWERIVFNLLSNAFKFTLAGEISVSIQEVNNSIILKVKDTGTGIPAEEIPKLFSRFHRIENAKGRTHEGSGIGLAMVAELVKTHGGNISVESEFGKGSTFTVVIPGGNNHLPADRISKINTQKTITLNAIPDIDEEIFHFNDTEKSDITKVKNDVSIIKERVLIADDNADMRDYISNLLKNRYEVITVKDGLEALNAIPVFKPSLVLSDVMMPNMDGLGLLKELRENKHTSRLPIILVSARAGEEATIEGIEAGADDYLVKPFSAKELISRVESNIRIAKTREAAEKNLENIFIHAPVAMVIMKGASHIIELANKNALELWGKSMEQVLNKPITDAFPELSDQGIFPILDQVFTTGETFIGSEILITLNRFGKSEERFINIVYNAYRNSENKIEGVMGLGVDVTDLVSAKKSAEQIARDLELANVDISTKNDLLVKINNDLDNFIYTASHDLKAPVANIEGLLNSMLESLSEESRKNTDFTQIMNLIDKSINRFKNTIRDLTEVSKAQKIFEEDVDQINCSEIIEDVKFTIQNQIKESEAKIEIDVENCNLVRFSRKNFHSIIYNLLSNTIKYKDPSRPLTVHVSSRREDGYFVLIVSDNGLGIKESNQARLFTMFKRFHDHVEGTGIGLYIVKKIIDNAGGKIEVKSEEGVGTTFKVYLKQ